MLNKCRKQLDIGDAANDEIKDPRFHCIQCGKPCSGSLYSFSGGFAGESCVRAYYQNMYPDLSNAGLAEELRCRKYEAAWLIKTEGKHRRKSRASREYTFCDSCGASHKTEDCEL